MKNNIVAILFLATAGVVKGQFIHTDNVVEHIVHVYTLIVEDKDSMVLVKEQRYLTNEFQDTLLYNDIYTFDSIFDVMVIYDNMGMLSELEFIGFCPDIGIKQTQNTQALIIPFKAKRICGQFGVLISNFGDTRTIPDPKNLADKINMSYFDKRGVKVFLKEIKSTTSDPCTF